MNDQNNNQGSNGQRISVRPGNFTPPPQRGAQPKPRHTGTAAQEAPTAGENRQGGQKQGGHGGHHNRRRHDNRHHGGEHREEQKNRPQAANASAEAAQQKAQGGQNHNGQVGGHRGGHGNQRPREDRREKRSAPQGAKPSGEVQSGGNAERTRVNASQNKPPQQAGRGGKNHKNRQRDNEQKKASGLSATLQKELDDEFNTPTLASFHTSPTKKKATEEVVDSREFEVDISTAAYLIEDVPTGIPAPGDKSVEVVGVRFRQAGKVYFFAPAGMKFAIGDAAIVDTARGPELGDIVMLNRRIAEREIIQPLRSVLRRATKEDLERNAANRAQEEEALVVCAEKIKAHKLDMRLVDAQYAFDNSKLLFYFTSEGRVDFRELVRDLASVFHTRIELRQIGIRDEARLIGGLGMCGRPFCCATFLSDFGQVSVKMAKEQGLSINTSKISGCCGRLMCCLRYEHETYLAEARLTPKKDTVVETPDGVGTVVEATPLSGLLKVRLEGAEEEAPRVYHRDDVTVRGKGGQKQAPEKDTAPEATSEETSAEPPVTPESTDAE